MTYLKTGAAYIIMERRKPHFLQYNRIYFILAVCFSVTIQDNKRLKLSSLLTHKKKHLK